MSPRHRRLIRPLAGHLIAGLLISVLVAWTLANIPPSWRPDRYNLSFSAEQRGWAWWLATRADHVGFTSIAWMCNGGDGLQTEVARNNSYLMYQNSTGVLAWAPISLIPFALPLWSDFRGRGPHFIPDPAGHLGAYSQFTEIAQGWPFRCLHGSTRALPTWMSPHNLPRSGLWYPTDQHIFAFRPVLPGLAANAIFYALAVGGISPAFFAWRRRRRIRKGLCAACAYSLAGLAPGSPCPECGRTAQSGPTAAGMEREVE